MSKKLMRISYIVVLSLIVVGFSANQSFEAFDRGTASKSMVILGSSSIVLDANKTVGVQVDRVIRAIYGRPPGFDEHVPTDRIPKNSSQINSYMEGARVRELMDLAGVKVLPLTPCRAKRSGPHHLAADGQGHFPFLISPSKIGFPPFNKTVYSPKNASNETADLICPDTHGFNMIAEQAYIHRKEIDLAVACMDLPSKAMAALYLAKNGIDIYAPCDRFAPNLMNYKAKFGANATILGSAPIRQTEGGAVIGDQPVVILLNESIIVEYNEKNDTPSQYCDAPWRYFNKLNEAFGLKLTLIKVTADVGEAGKVVRKAEELNAHVIGVRVCKVEDYQPVAAWLKEDVMNRAVLLHSASYEPGNSLFKEFPAQTTFGDLNPIVE